MSSAFGMAADRLRHNSPAAVAKVGPWMERMPFNASGSGTGIRTPDLLITNFLII